MIELIQTCEGLFASIKGDSHMTVWIKEHGSLCTDKTVPVKILPLLKEGDVCLDIGSNIGSHAYQYSKKVGPKGKVIAFEPYLESFCCLLVNARDCDNIECRLQAVGDNFDGGVSMEVASQNNFGTARISNVANGHISMIRIDDLYLERVNFCKIDAEGYEPNILRGMVETLRRCRPILFIEINRSALAYFGFNSSDITDFLYGMDYESEGMLDLNADQVDVLFFPKH